MANVVMCRDIEDINNGRRCAKSKCKRRISPLLVLYRYCDIDYCPFSLTYRIPSTVLDTLSLEGINIMSESYLDVANHSCDNFPSNVDEFIESGLTKAKCDLVAAPRVQEAAISFECQLDHVQHPLWDQKGNPTTEVVLVRAVRIDSCRFDRSNSRRRRRL